ncbi:hypothetical protein JAK51_16940 [Stenotrophomonas maltophilia]|uniref:hypothetical protein n=1 Tax=Stenotrophomonas maltophilia TaxID=40324 RepID=UPI0021C5B055|nr:hypothetical protein [Stenotrophomonas maltophilia]MCU1127903.1 hypothetical protein [Stenotrophomonas maltophilia]
MSALVGIFAKGDIPQIQRAMARPGGNPDLKAVRNAETAKATQKLQLKADSQAEKVSGALLFAVRQGLIQQAANGHDKAEWRAWLNNLNDDRYLTLRKRPWTKKALNRMLNRMKERGLTPQDPDSDDAQKWLSMAQSTAPTQSTHPAGNKVGN